MAWHSCRTGVANGCHFTKRNNTSFLAFGAQILFTVRKLCDSADQGLGLMRVQLVTDYMPAGCLEVGLDHVLQMGQEIGLGTRRSAERCHDLSRDDIAAEDKSACAVANVLKLASLHLFGSQRQVGVFALQGLNPGQLIGTDRAFSFCSFSLRVSSCGFGPRMSFLPPPYSPLASCDDLHVRGQEQTAMCRSSRQYHAAEC